MHTNTIAIFLIEITTNERLKSYNNLLYYRLRTTIIKQITAFN
jgi:hypothetical protein